MPVDQASANTLVEFLLACVTESLETARSRSEQSAESYFRQSQAIVLDMRHDLETEPQRSAEVLRYLVRMALAYEDRPGFQSQWLLFASA